MAKLPMYLTVAHHVAVVRATGKYYNRWISENVLLKLIHEISTDYNYGLETLRRAYGHPALFDVNMLQCTNNFGVYKRSYRVNGKKVAYFYYFTKSKVAIPQSTVNWHSKSIISMCQLKRRQSKRLQSQSQVQYHRNTTDTHDYIPNDTQTVDESNQDIYECPIVNDSKKSTNIKEQTKWDSPEALSLFVQGTKASRQRFGEKKGQNESNERVDVKKHVISQVDALRRAYLTPKGWRNILDDKDEKDLCSSYDIFSIQVKCKYLAATLSKALIHYDTTLTFNEICASAIDKVNEFDFDGIVDEDVCDDTDSTANSPNHSAFMKITNPKTVMTWLRTFRCDNNFPNPARVRSDRWDKGLPRIFNNNPELYFNLMKYLRSNLSTLSGAMVHEYLFEIALPETVERIRKHRLMGRPFTVKEFLLQNDIKVLNIRTIYKWLKRLGFTYSPSRKSYYVDSHEKPENILYRSQFIERYHKLEQRTHRWIHIPLAIYEKMVTEGELVRECGFQFEKEGDTYVELHVDDHPKFQADCEHLPFGGHLSVRKGVHEKPLIIFGQDECIFKQFNLSSKSWSDPNGTRALLPKDEGQGVMISAFVSREFGFGMTMTPDQLDKVNRQRSRGKRKFYSDENAAISKSGTKTKPILTRSPFVQTFDYGNNNDGYWTYDCMVMQMEDCIDCLQTLYPSFDICFLFDHSNGHDRLQPDGLNSNRINKNFGGKQPTMRSSVIKTKDYLGPFHSDQYKLQVGDTQSMTFAHDDPGPFYLSPADVEKRKYDVETNRQRQRPILKERLVEMLEAENIVNPKGNLKKLQQQCKALNLPIRCSETVIIEGWVGKPKGAFQILYERGWIDPSNLRQYTEKGKVNEMGILLENTSINLMIQNQPDFVSELTLLQYHGNKLGVLVDRTPKCHPELAGEGIEYVWALAKLHYRNQPLVRKRTKEAFRTLVDESLSLDNLDIVRVRKCSRRAREYMLLYKAYAQVMRSEGNKLPISEINNRLQGLPTTLNYELIEKSIKTYKSHRNARDFDAKFIKNLKLDSQNCKILKMVVNEMKTSF
jgi:hypothetical protein